MTINIFCILRQNIFVSIAKAARKEIYMFFKKCEKKHHPYMAAVIGALAVVGFCSIKKCGMDFVKEKWGKLTSAFSSGKCSSDTTAMSAGRDS